MTRTIIVTTLALAACSGKKEPSTEPAREPLDCAALTGDNAVQAEMRKLECALQQAVAAIGRDDLAAVPRWIHVVHEAKQATEQALESGAYALPRGDLAAFVSMDEAFHDSLVTLLRAADAGDHAATATALGNTLGQCQGCHAVFRATKPAAAPPPADGHGH
jgi:hypothetical protein